MTHRFIIFLLGCFAFGQSIRAQRFHFFAQEVRALNPSVVYDFLERYLYELDSLQRRGEDIKQQLRDDKVIFLSGSPSAARHLSPEHSVALSKTDDKFYQMTWTDTLGHVLLDIAFPMQYELLLGKPKAEIEKAFKDELLCIRDSFVARQCAVPEGRAEDACFMSDPQAHYYVHSMNDATYFQPSADSAQVAPTFSSSDKWHSAANLFQGIIAQVGNRLLYVEQNLYGFQQTTYMVQLAQWLRYCQMMQLSVYFAVEEEREDGLLCLLIAHSTDLAFNHMLSLLLPDDFVGNPNCTIKAKMNAYIPTQNVKNLYQQYVAKPKKKI